jgi:type 1 glutamine amidotransferase
MKTKQKIVAVAGRQSQGPEDGVKASCYDPDAVSVALAGITDGARDVAKPGGARIKVLMIEGNDAHKWHNWETTSPAIKAQLEQDVRIQVDVTRDFENVTKLAGGGYHVLALNYCNWKDPRQLSDAAKESLPNWLSGGGGLLAIHFCNGAFHFSLPDGSGSDWPEYRRMVRRVWNHDPTRGKASAHDQFGAFTVSVTMGSHPIVRGLNTFQVEDELYFEQDGEEPIEPMIAAKSLLTGKDEPLAWSYNYGKGRVFQSLLGHSAKTYEAWEAGEMLRRATAWAAGKEVHENQPAGQPK